MSPPCMTNWLEIAWGAFVHYRYVNSLIIIIIVLKAQRLAISPEYLYARTNNFDIISSVDISNNMSTYYMEMSIGLSVFFLAKIIGIKCCFFPYLNIYYNYAAYSFSCFSGKTVSYINITNKVVGPTCMLAQICCRMCSICCTNNVHTFNCARLEMRSQITSFFHFLSIGK